MSVKAVRLRSAARVDVPAVRVLEVAGLKIVAGWPSFILFTRKNNCHVTLGRPQLAGSVLATGTVEPG
jgi:hypothetical protein